MTECKIKILVADNSHREILKVGSNHLLIHDNYLELVWNHKMRWKETDEEVLYYEKTGIPKSNDITLVFSS